jgi:hypothetical protein
MGSIGENGKEENKGKSGWALEVVSAQDRF